METIEQNKAIGSYNIKVYDGTTLLRDIEVKNLITSVGKAAMAGLVGNTGSVVAFTFLALGTSATAPAIGDTTLTAELSTLGLSRVAATVSRVNTVVTNDTLKLVGNWTASGSTTINEIGALNASSSGILLSHALSGAISVVNGNSVVATFTLQFP